ncbi:MAG: response regulator [Bacteroidota bacterium]
MDLSKIKILAIDDNNDNLITLKALVNEAFPAALFFKANSGKKGLEIAIREIPNVILLDIIMPEMNGYEVCEVLKSDISTSDIPVVFIASLQGDRESHIRALEVGAEAFLAKPIEATELTAQLRAMLKIREAYIQKRDEKERLKDLVEKQTRKLRETHIATLNLLEDLHRENTARKNSEKALIKAKEKAEESDRLKSAFLANMSHEIRTPMNGILGFACLLKEPGLTGNEQQKFVEIIEQSGARMLNIINDIIDISKIESGQAKTLITESNINEQLEYLYAFFKPEVDKKGIELINKNILIANEAMILTDREKIYAILTNLIKNAIKFTDHGTIEFGCEKKGDFLEFFVKDTGVGIAENRQNAIFERFIQADISDKRAFQGAGLGLSIAKAYIEMLGGKVWVKSTVEQGSVFYFTIPYVIQQSGELSLKNYRGPEENLNTNLKILIAEDDEAAYVLINLALKGISKNIIHAPNGLEAVKKCRENPDIDIIMMDIKMPGLNGYEATEEIRKFNKNVVIIAQTAFGLSGDKDKAIKAGCNDYISKPIDKNILRSLVKKYFPGEISKVL